jgi:hypothetical protein
MIRSVCAAKCRCKFLIVVLMLCLSVVSRMGVLAVRVEMWSSRMVLGRL